MAFYTQIDTTQQQRLGLRKRDPATNEYVYAKGAASTVAYDVVTFDENWASTRLAANARGQVGVAQAAIVANQFGWYMVKGNAPFAKAVTVLADKPCFACATAAAIDDAVVTGDKIDGMTTMAADSGGFAAVQLSYPVMNGNG